MPQLRFGDRKRTSAEGAAALILSAIWLLAMSGCGSASHELETSPVNGRVTLDGQPLPSGYVFVLPERGRMAKGSIQSNGTFTLGTYRSDDGVQVGRHGVIVTEVPGDERTAVGAQKIVRVSVPRRYANASTSGLAIDVKPGQRNEVELQLTKVGD